MSRSINYTSSPLLASKTPVWRSKFIVAALAVDGLDWWNAGLRGDASGQGAAIFAMLAWHGSVVLAVVLSAFYYLARWVRGLAPAPANKTLEALRILFLYAALEGTAGLLLPRLLPWSGL